MEILKGRPEITGADHPNTIYRALLGSYALWGHEQPKEAREYWTKQAQDAQGALQDGFGILDPDTAPLHPDGKALLYMSPEDLEYALVGYGITLLDDPQKNTSEIENVEETLQAINKVRH